MTPLHPAIADGPAHKLHSWRIASKILACSLASMTIAVVVMAWQVTRLTRERNRAAARAIPALAFPGPSRPPAHLVRDVIGAMCDPARVRVGSERDCAVVAEMRRTHTGLYAP